MATIHNINGINVFEFKCTQETFEYHKKQIEKEGEGFTLRYIPKKIISKIELGNLITLAYKESKISGTVLEVSRLAEDVFIKIPRINFQDVNTIVYFGDATFWTGNVYSKEEF